MSATAEAMADAIARGDILPDGAAKEEKDPPEKVEGDKGAKGAAETEGKVEGEKVEGEGSDADKEEKEGKGKGEPRLPLSRHKELLNKERQRREAVENELKQYQRGSEVAKSHEDLTKAENSLLDLEKQYAKAMADGETEKATSLFTKIRHAERQILEAKSDAKHTESVARATEQARYDMALERVEETYPQLNPDHDDFDEEKLDNVSAMARGFQMGGMTPTKALQRAVKTLFPPATAAQEKATEVAPRVSDKDVAAQRKKDAAAKTADAMAKQPPSTDKAGQDNNRTTKITASDVMTMSQADFAKLSEEDLRKLRGDEL